MSAISNSFVRILGNPTPMRSDYICKFSKRFNFAFHSHVTPKPKITFSFLCIGDCELRVILSLWQIYERKHRDNYCRLRSRD